MKRPGLRAALAGGAALLAAACGAEPIEDSMTAPLPFEEVLTTRRSGLDAPLREVVRDEERWVALWGEIHRRVSPSPPLPTVDFSRQMLIVVALGTRRSSGFGVEVRSVSLHEGHLEVEVLETCPEPGDMAAMALTQPVEVIRLEKRSHDTRFREEKAPACE